MRDCRPILLVEDDVVDAMIVKRAFKDLNILNPLLHSVTAEEALEYLDNEDNQQPSLIILDLNMPKMSGIEFLNIAKAHDTLKQIPVIVLTTSKNEKDISESFKLNVAGYMLKPPDYNEFLETISVINRYWELSELPSRN